ncbi:MAG: hypothetical protein PHV82_02510 [Victivallaceae bacterium]|nr:hypothetical protein [Victivallaceae bacterium]
MNSWKTFLGIVMLTGMFSSLDLQAENGNWWKPTSETDKDKSWHFRIPLMVTAPGTLDYEGYPIEVGVDFNAALGKLSKATETLDLPNSLRLVDSDGKEIPCQYDDTTYKGKDDDTGNGKGTVVFVLDELKSGKYKKFFLYFDTIETGGMKKVPPYTPIKAMKTDKYGAVDTGKITVRLHFGGGTYRNGIKGLAVKTPEGDTKIPVYGYGVDSLGVIEMPFKVVYTRGPVFAKFVLAETMNNQWGGIRTLDDKKLKGREKFLWQEPKDVKITFTFFNDSSIWHLDLKEWNQTANYMGKGFFTSYQDSSMESPGSLKEVGETKYGYVRHKARYGIVSSENGYSFATAVWDNAWNGKSREAAMALFNWCNKAYNVYPSIGGISPASRIKHNLKKGGMETALALDNPPMVICNPNQIENTK